MRLSELGEKEIVNLSTGSRHGELADTELLFDPRKGKIKAILIPEYTGHFGFMSSRDFIQLPWSSIRKIGDDIIIFDANQ